MAVLPTTNISTTLARNTLGEDNNDVGLLCKSPKINMWSKRKPVRYPADFIADPNDVGKTLDHKWGLTLANFIGVTPDGNDDDRRTVYNRPNGGSSQPYRIGDFRGYNHDANIPLVIPPRSSNQPIYRQPFMISAIVSMDDPHSLTLLDFGLRLGCYVYEHGTSNFLGSASASSDGGADVEIDLTNYVNVDYVDVFFLLTNTYKEWGWGGISTMYEPFRPESGLLNVNADWIKIPLLDPGSGGYPAITYFNIIHKPGLQDKIDIMVRTYLWAAPPVGTDGDLFVQITHIENGNPTPDANITLNITQVNTIITFTRSAPWIVPGRVYTAMIWMGNSMSGARDNECTFIALMEA